MASFTTFGPRYMGDLATVFYRDGDGITFPVLDIVQGEGRALDQDTAKCLADNIVSVLNDQNPVRPMPMQGLRVKWIGQTRGLHILFQKEPDLRTVTGALAMFNDTCPPAMVGKISRKLTEEGGLARVLALVHMTGMTPHIDRDSSPSGP
jgi:hypothetical protein